MTLTTERLKQLAEPNMCSWDEYKSMIAELLANREAQPVITDEAIDRIVVPLSPDGLDEEKHHCEWHLYHDRERIRKELREYFTAPPAPAVPDGFKLVPTVPTPEMIAAAMNCDDVTFINLEDFCVNFGNIYAAMLAAAPGES